MGLRIIGKMGGTIGITIGGAERTIGNTPAGDIIVLVLKTGKLTRSAGGTIDVSVIPGIATVTEGANGEGVKGSGVGGRHIPGIGNLGSKKNEKGAITGGIKGPTGVSL